MIPLPPSPLLSADTCKFMQISPVIMWNEINKLRGGGVRVHYSRYSFHWILAEILQDSAGLFRILWGFFGFFLYHCADVSMGRLDNSRFTEDSLGFFGILWDSPGFFGILRGVFAFLWILAIIWNARGMRFISPTSLFCTSLNLNRLFIEKSQPIVWLLIFDRLVRNVTID